ncbi:MAG: hypothetical protein ACK4F9_07505 [Brevinematia bacterium]
MVYNVSTEKIILSAFEDKENAGVMFVGPKGVFKLFSSEIIISKFLEDYPSYIPFNHSDIFVAGPYYYDLYYKFFEKNFDFVLNNRYLNDLFVRFVGFCIANRSFSDDEGVASDLILYLDSIRKSKTLDKSDFEKLFYCLEVVTKKLSRIESIGIDVIREIIKFATRASLSGYKFVVISDFDKATVEAQNAFLKILEEPPKGVFFILTTSNYNNVLPTIKSRVFRVSFLKIKGQELKSYFDGILNLDVDSYYSFYDLMLENVYDISGEFFSNVLKVMISRDLDFAMDFVEKMVESYVLVEKFFELVSKIINSMLEFRARFAGMDIRIDKDILSKFPKEMLGSLTVSKLYKLQSILDDGYRKVYTFNINPKFVITNFFVEFFDAIART